MTKAAVRAKVAALGPSHGGEDLGPGATCDCCNRPATRRVWWWQGVSERMNAWLCATHVV